jgi:trimethylamine--corrinoid protein Co-methyltransferase
MPKTQIGGRAHRSRRRQRAGSSRAQGGAPRLSGIVGGRYQPLNPADLPRLDQAVRKILQDVGMSEAPDVVVERVTAAGGSLDADGRLRFTADLIERALTGMPRDFSLCGQHPEHDMRLGGGRVHVGSGGAAPLLLDLETGHYRDSNLRDLYDAARLVDSLDNIHFFSRSLVARDMPDTRSLDLNTAYACLTGTSKHVFSSVSLAAHVEEIADMCFTIAGPLRFDPDSCEVMAEAARLGIPLHSNTFGQMGASSPVTMAGTIAQTIAETLSGMIFAWLINPQARVVFGTRPMLTDLRTGAMSGGSPEGAIAMAASAQMANYYGLPGSTIAGATDSKVADAQSGYEKSLAVTLAAQAGSNLITQAAGMQASLMGCALESYVIDNDMLGGIMKSLSAIEVSDETLALDAIEHWNACRPTSFIRTSVIGAGSTNGRLTVAGISARSHRNAPGRSCNGIILNTYRSSSITLCASDSIFACRDRQWRQNEDRYFWRRSDGLGICWPDGGGRA